MYVSCSVLRRRKIILYTIFLSDRHRGSEALVFITCAIPAWAGLYLLPWYKLLRPLEAHQRRKGVRPLDEVGPWTFCSYNKYITSLYCKLQQKGGNRLTQIGTAQHCAFPSQYINICIKIIALILSPPPEKPMQKQDPEGEASFYAAVKRGGAEFVARYGYQPPLPSFGVSSGTRAFLDEMFSFTAAQPVKAFERMIGQKHVPVPMETPKQLRMEAALAIARPALGSEEVPGSAGAAHTRATTPANGDGETAHVGAVSIDIGTAEGTTETAALDQPPGAGGAAADPYYGSEWDGGGGDGTAYNYDEDYADGDPGPEPGPEYVYLGPEGEGGSGEEAQAQAQGSPNPADDYYDGAYGY